MEENVGTVGSPSTTVKATVDILEDATGSSLHGQLVYFSHVLDIGHLFALGTVIDIKTTNHCHKIASTYQNTTKTSMQIPLLLFLFLLYIPPLLPLYLLLSFFPVFFHASVLLQLQEEQLGKFLPIKAKNKHVKLKF